MALQEIALERAINMLKAAGAQYKIITANGMEFGDLEVVVPKQRKRKVYTRPYGELRDYYTPFIVGMNPGEIVSVPFGPYDGEDLRGPVTAWCCSHWGRSNYTTFVNKDRGCVEVMRTK